MKKIFVSLLALAALGVCPGCQSQNTTSTKKTGSYTAARRNSVGSHIPQPYSADNVDSTVDDSFMRDQARMNNTNGSMGGSRGGR